MYLFMGDTVYSDSSFNLEDLKPTQFEYSEK